MLNQSFVEEKMFENLQNIQYLQENVLCDFFINSFMKSNFVSN